MDGPNHHGGILAAPGPHLRCFQFRTFIDDGYSYIAKGCKVNSVFEKRQILLVLANGCGRIGKFLFKWSGVEVGVNHSLLDYFLNASPVVKLVMLILLLASVVSWALIFHRGSFLKQARKQMQNFQEKFEEASDLTQVWGSLSNRKANRQLTGPASIFQAGFKEFIRYKKQGASINATLDGVERALAIAEAKELDKLDRHLSLLATIGSTSPYVGLFGTVWGIMMSFQALSSVQQATMPMVAPGISEALIATAMGLFAAIPAVVAYNRFNSAVNRIANQYATFREEVVAAIARQMQGAVGQKPVVETRYAEPDFEDEEQYA
jgi:biopolymer transport protein TolQ